MLFPGLLYEGTCANACYCKRGGKYRRTGSVAGVGESCGELLKYFLLSRIITIRANVFLNPTKTCSLVAPHMQRLQGRCF